MAKKRRVLVLHGPNLNLLGKRQPEIYGRLTLEQINRKIRDLAQELGVEVNIRQSNSEGELVNWIQESSRQFGALVINAAKSFWKTQRSYLLPWVKKYVPLL